MLEMSNNVQCVFLQWRIARWCLGDLVLNIRAAKVSILLTEMFYFHILWIAKCILFYKPEPTVCWLWYVLHHLSTFKYIEIMMMFWSTNMICGFRVSISWRFKLCKLSKKWYVKLFMDLKKACVKSHSSWKAKLYGFEHRNIDQWVASPTA
jgi:hypothetical protein